MLKKPIFLIFLSLISGIASVSQPSLIIFNAPKDEVKFWSKPSLFKELLSVIFLTFVPKKFSQYFSKFVRFEPLPINKWFTPLLKLNPETGRKHQLRKQLLIHGNPILGDTKYRMLKNYSTKRNTLMLHAYRINFSIAGIKYNFSAEPPLAFRNTLKEKYLKIF